MILWRRKLVFQLLKLHLKTLRDMVKNLLDTKEIIKPIGIFFLMKMTENFS